MWVVDVSDAASGWGRVGSGPSVRVVFSVWGVPSACVNFKARWWWWDDAGAVAVEVTRLLHFGEFEVEQVVDPVEELRASHEERGMLEPDGRRVRRSHRRDLDSGGDGARWFAVRACDAGFGVVDDDDARARCSRVETVEERRWWYSASRAGFWRVLAARLSPLDVSPGRWFPRAERRNHSTQRCPAATLMRDLFCSVAKNAPLQKMQIRRIQGQSKPPLGRTRTRMTSAKTWC